jgi:hypothetical protein
MKKTNQLLQKKSRSIYAFRLATKRLGAVSTDPTDTDPTSPVTLTTTQLK